MNNFSIRLCWVIFISSELGATNLGLTLRQQTAFPDEPRTSLTLKLNEPAEFTLYLRHPGWVGHSIIRGADNFSRSGIPSRQKSSPAQPVAVSTSNSQPSRARELAQSMMCA
jgi:hypothetical protein